MAKPAIVAKTTATGTTPSTMSTLEIEQGVHVGVLEGLEEVAPLRARPARRCPGARLREGWMAVVKRLTNGTIVTTMSTMSRSRPVQTSRAADDHAGSSRVSRWMGRTATRTRTTRTTASADARPDLTAVEREAVDLEAGDGRRGAGATTRRDVDDVERGQRGDDRDGDADPDLVAQAGTVIERNSCQALAPSMRADSYSAWSILLMPVSSRMVQRPRSTQAPMTPTAGSASAEVRQPGTREAAEPDRAEDLVDKAVLRRAASST